MYSGGAAILIHDCCVAVVEKQQCSNVHCACMQLIYQELCEGVQTAPQLPTFHTDYREVFCIFFSFLTKLLENGI